MPTTTARAYATQPFVWTLGGIIGSAMGGFLAKPAEFYPNVFSQDGIFGRFPYLLPNVVAAGAIVLAIIQGIIFLEETNPALKKDASLDREEDDTVSEINERTPLHGTRRMRDRARSSFSTRASFRDRSHSVLEAIREVRKRPSFLEASLPMPIEQTFDIRRTSFGTMHSIIIPPERHHPVSTRTPPPQKTYNKGVVMITLALVIICFHQMAFISVIPVWILDEPHTRFGRLDFWGGLGYSLHDVGTYLAVNGFIALFIQGVIFPFFVEALGVWKSFVSMVVLYPVCYLLIPFLSALPAAYVSPGVYGIFILQNLFGIIVFPCALILLKNAVPSPLVLGRVNGMSMSACCLARTISSPMVGILYSVGGSAAAWFGLAGVAVLGAVQLCWIPRKVEVDAVEVRSVVPILPSGRRESVLEGNAIDDESVYSYRGSEAAWQRRQPARIVE